MGQAVARLFFRKPGATGADDVPAWKMIRVTEVTKNGLLGASKTLWHGLLVEIQALISTIPAARPKRYRPRAVAKMSSRVVLHKFATQRTPP